MKFGLLLYQIQRDSWHQSDTLLHTKPVGEKTKTKHTNCIFNSKVCVKKKKKEGFCYSVSAFKIELGWKTFSQHNQSHTGPHDFCHTPEYMAISSAECQSQALSPWQHSSAWGERGSWGGKERGMVPSIPEEPTLQAGQVMEAGSNVSCPKPTVI